MIRHIVAIDRQRGIAKNGVQPWKLPMDERYFTDMTKTHGGVVLMGSTTYEVIGQPLSGRTNVVASRDANFKAPGATVITDIQTFLNQQDDVWVIGGAQIYAATLSMADELYVTEIDAKFDCDVFYPEFIDQFRVSKLGELQQENGLPYCFNLYVPR